MPARRPGSLGSVASGFVALSKGLSAVYLVNALVQAGLAFALAVVWWLIATRRRQRILPWLGLMRPRLSQPRRFWLVAAAAFLAFGSVGLASLNLVRAVPGLAVSPFEGMGWQAVPQLAAYAVVQTSFSEEVVFRGLLGKSLIRAWGFGIGNVAQALAFGVLHGLMFASVLGWGWAVGLTLFAGATGWLLGYLNERLAGGSILPSWALHALANVVAGCWAAFAW